LKSGGKFILNLIFEVFRRGGNEPPPVVADLLPHGELLKKIDERKTEKENDENGKFL
jgi:hypothetical protein